MPTDDDHPLDGEGSIARVTHVDPANLAGESLKPSPTNGLWALGLAILLLIASLVAPPTISAQRGEGEARFIDTSASSVFQESMTFRLDVESDDVIAEVALFWHPRDDPELSAEFPEIEPGTDIELEHEVDTSIDYLPPGLDIVYFWRVTEDDGDVSESAEQTLFYIDENLNWDTVTDGLVTVYWHAGNDTFSGDILDTATRTSEGLGDRFQVEADEPMRIIVYSDDDAFADALQANSAEWIGGQAFPWLNLIVAYIEPGRGSETEIQRMIPHEVSHLIVSQATENPYNSAPTWLDEGLAVYNQEAQDQNFDDLVLDAVEDGRLIPVRALNASFPVDPDQAILSYAESLSIVTYIIETHGDEALSKLVNVFREEVTYDEAVQRSLGMTIDELDLAWKAWLGYEGDRPIAAISDDDDVDVGIDPIAPQVASDETEDLTTNELIFLLSCTGIFSLAGLALMIYSILRIRRMGS